MTEFLITVSIPSFTVYLKYILDSGYVAFHSHIILLSTIQELLTPRTWL